MRDSQDTTTNDMLGGIRIGYARVSTDDQMLSMQLDALRTAGCVTTYQEHASSKQADRPELAHAIKALRKGDTLVVWRLDRLGRSLPHLVSMVTDIEALGASFESVTERIETRSATGRLTFHLFAALAEFERNLISERTIEGLKAARRRGNRGGRKPALDAKAVAQVRALMSDHSIKPSDIARRFGVSRTTIYKAARDAQVEVG